MHIEELEDQLVVVASVEGGAKFEARCHLCPWTVHKWTEDDARVWLRNHIIDEHLTPME